MTKPICVVCAIARGKRACKLNELKLVCPRCCAQIRGEDCVGCPYYSQAVRYRETRSKPKHFIAAIDPQVDAMVDQALTMVERGDLVGGEKAVTEIFHKHPDLHSVQFAMGVVCVMKEEYEPAIGYFEKAIEIFPYYVEAWQNKARSHQRKLEIPQMIRAFQKVVEYGDPAEGFVQDAEEMLTELSHSVREQGCASLDVFVQANEVFDRAFMHMQKGDYLAAIAGFKRSSAMNPNSPQAYGNMGICYSFLNDREKALAAYDKALAIDPHYEPAIVNKAAVMAFKEGQSLADARQDSIEYYKDFTSKNRSLLNEYIGRD